MPVRGGQVFDMIPDTKARVQSEIGRLVQDQGYRKILLQTDGEEISFSDRRFWFSCWLFQNAPPLILFTIDPSNIAVCWGLVSVYFALDKPYAWHDFVSYLFTGDRSVATEPGCRGRIIPIVMIQREYR